MSKRSPALRTTSISSSRSALVGFWGDSFPSERSVRTERPLPALAPPAFATGAAVPESGAAATGNFTSRAGAAEPASSVVADAGARSRSRVGNSSYALRRFPKPPASSPSRAARVSPGSDRTIGPSSGSQGAPSVPKLLTAGRGLFRWRRSSSKKMLWAATFVMAVGTDGGGIHARPPRPIRAARAPQLRATRQASRTLAHDALLYSYTPRRISAALKTTRSPLQGRSPQPHRPPPLNLNHRRSRRRRPNPGSAVQPTAGRSGITVEKLRAPVRRRAATFASGEPPSVPMPQGAENVLGGLLSAVSGPSTPRRAT
jgi:hypothetical protein